MHTRVTAIVVAREGGEWIEQTLAGLAEQTRQADRLVLVVNGGPEGLGKELAQHAGAAIVVSTGERLAFGAAVKRGIAALPADQHSAVADVSPAGAQQEDWYWLLGEDTAPEPQALEEILATVLRAPSVAVAGPKLVNWDHPDRIVELGQSLTKSGDRWLLRRQERDQQQYDHLQDVLGVGPVGMLVRADVWQQLEGFDPAYPVYDDGLDFSVRARLAGYRVVVSPTSRVRFAQRGVVGPRIDHTRRSQRVAHREARTAHLHRRISYAPAFAAFFMWLGLPLVALGRVVWALLRERPGSVWGEFSSALRVFFSVGSLFASRRRIKKVNSAGWSSVDPLRVDAKTVRTARMIDREAILVSQGRLRNDLHFISTGGLGVLIAATVGSVALTWWAITQNALSGLGLAPLSDLSGLWENTQTLNGVPADPFTWVLALLGTLTSWNPSYAIVLVLVLSIPLAALGGWLWAAQLTSGAAGRVLLAIAWAFSPVLLGSLAAGRLPTVILAIVLPWLLLAATRCRDSWSWSGITSLLAAVALACAPVLLPAAIVLLVAGLFTSRKHLERVLAVALAPIVLFAPKLFLLLRGGDPLDLLLDPGIILPFAPGNTWQLLLGFPEFGLAGWGGIFDNLGLNVLPATALVGVLLLPIVLLSALGLLTGRVNLTVLQAVLGGVGLLTAVAASRLQLLADGGQEVALWTGSGLALYWIAVLGLAVIGAGALQRAAAPIVAVSLIAALIAVAPLAVKLATNGTGIVAGDSQMPAIVQAAGSQDPGIHTLVLTAQGEGSVRAQLVTGAGLRLDQQRSSGFSAELTPQDEWVADLVGKLASTGDSTEMQALLSEHGVAFVLLSTTGDGAERSLLQAAIDQNAALENAGQTEHGLLWRTNGDVTGVLNDDGAGWIERGLGSLIWWVQIIVLAGMLLLALPTGEVVERPARRAKAKRNVSVSPATDVASATDVTHSAEDGAESEDAADVPAAAAVPAAADAADAADVPAVPAGGSAVEGDPAAGGGDPVPAGDAVPDTGLAPQLPEEGSER